MSGVLSLLREVYYAYLAANGTTISPRHSLEVLGHLSIVAFIISAAVLLFLEHDQAKKLQAKLAKNESHEFIRTRIGRYLGVVRKFTKVCNDPNQIVPKKEIDEWEKEVCVYLRENLNEADEVLFMSEAGIVDAPPCKFIEERAEPLRLLHYRSHRLLQILERLSK